LVAGSIPAAGTSPLQSKKQSPQIGGTLPLTKMNTSKGRTADSCKKT